VRHALRRLRSSPAFTIAATLTLAIAIGATTSVFSVVDGVLLRAFPYRDPERVRVLWESNPERHMPRSLVATANYFDWRAESQGFSSIAVACCGTALRLTVAGDEGAERVTGLAVTPNYFDVLGVTPILGRTLAADTSGPREVVISYGYWQRRFGGKPSVLGTKLIVDNPNDARPTRQHAYTVVGVTPRGLPGPVEMWTGIFFEPVEQNNRDIRYLDAYGRLAPGVTPERGARELEMIAGRLASSYPKTKEHWSVTTAPLVDELVGSIRPMLVTLLAAAACVLLIGAANLANLFLVRCVAREREMALRTALGATRGRLIRELVIEAAILGVAAGALGVGVAIAGVRVLRAFAPAMLPRVAEIGVDGRVIAFSAFVSLATVFIFGVLPAWQASRADLAGVLKEGGRGTDTARRHRLQDALVVAQVAVALVLMTGAGLLVASFARFARMDPGFRPEGVLTAQIAFPAERYPTAGQQSQFLTSLLEQLTAGPGVLSASVSDVVPAWSDSYRAPFVIIGDATPDPGHAPQAIANFVSPNYFRTMGIRVLRGRGILATDDSRAVHVAVVDSLLAQRFFNGRDPVGQRLAITLEAPVTVEIVGVVASVKENGLAADVEPTIYGPFAQTLGARIVQAFVSIRTAGDPDAQVPALRRTVASLDRLVPISDIKTMSERMGQSVDATRFSTVLASLFAVVALVLGVVGIYSVLAYIVAQRQREIAIRLALGAHRTHVLRQVVWRALALTGVGIGLGSSAAWILTRVLEGLFLGVSPHDPGIFVGAAAVFAGVALAAASVPALRATRVNPARVLGAA
jgi:putative ABC transport system permease protein